MKFLIYFFAGLLLDVLVTLQQLAVVRHFVLAASLLTMVIVVMSTMVLASVIEYNSLLHVSLYALGAAAGTAVAMAVWRKKGPRGVK